MELILIRHTEPDVKPGTCYGRTDVALSDIFEESAKKIHSELINEKIHLCYSSPSSRCMILAEFLKERLNISEYNPNIKNSHKEIKKDNRLMELDFGKWEMYDWKDIPGADFKFWSEDWVHNKTPCGESYKDLSNRVGDFLDEIYQIHQNKRIMIVTHSGVIRAFISMIEGVPLNKTFDFDIKFGEIRKLRVKK